MSTICHNFTCDCGARVQVWFSQIIEAMACPACAKPMERRSAMTRDKDGKRWTRIAPAAAEKKLGEGSG